MSSTEKEKVIRKLEKKTGAPENFFNNLLNSENDWSFIVKLHSFLEAACTQLITSALSKNELEDIISRLDMSDKSKGKSALIKEGDCILGKPIPLYCIDNTGNMLYIVFFKLRQMFLWPAGG